MNLRGGGEAFWLPFVQSSRSAGLQIPGLPHPGPVYPPAVPPPPPPPLMCVHGGKGAVNGNHLGRRRKLLWAAPRQHAARLISISYSAPAGGNF